MSDDFIPLNQSTPVQKRWHQDKSQQYMYLNNRNQNSQRRGGYNNKWGNGSRGSYGVSNGSRSSYGSNSSNNSYGQDSKANIDAYLHPSMLQDPWANLRKNTQSNDSTINDSSTS